MSLLIYFFQVETTSRRAGLREKTRKTFIDLSTSTDKNRKNIRELDIQGIFLKYFFKYFFFQKI